ncbi:MAG: phosphate ABC transporter substrate-binding protein [Pelotomaculum sp.]|uniref:Phosphate-binding protein n=1 Tax=Pelotomaculum thermopropionicum (strain DSM 13744 / JCM 10971 / SI) TaxID=370438 RepID=A5D1L6_PELTS|nr:phosphate ABC transporter substrate-binding protein [Pelotomaculum sp.]BAF59853.1 ABC-type phosphate transport system, permease component [Pelotomaculum thermopropionicum SI]
MKKTKWIVLAVLCLAALAALAGCGGRDRQGTAGNRPQLSGNITAVGSTAMQPLVEQAANQFMAKHPNVKIVVQGGGSGTGLTQVAQGAADIGNSDIFAEEKDGIDASQLVDHQICVVGMAAVVNPAVNIDNLTRQQLVDIFTGKITNWKDVGGPDQKVVLVNRPKASGTRATFKKYALGGAEEAAGIEEDSSGTVRKIVKETPGAIGYLALSYLDGSVKAIKLDGVEPSKENITSGKYPVWAYQHSYTKGKPSGALEAFLNYIMTDEVQKSIIPQLGYIPVTEMKVVRDASGNVKSK